jgi:hypothetical protein
MNYGQANHYIRNSTIRSDHETGYGPAEQSLGLDPVDPKAGHRAIPQAFANLEKDLHALGELVNVLNNRLRPISRSESPQVEKEESNPIVGVQMVNAIATADRSLRMSLRVLNDIIERLEV